MLRTAIISRIPSWRRIFIEFSVTLTTVGRQNCSTAIRPKLTLPACCAHMCRKALFLCAESHDDATTIALHVEKVMPGIQVIAVGRSCSRLRQGSSPAFAILAAPFERRCVTECLKRVNDNLSRRPVRRKSESSYSFLPAKPGAGATTLAINSHCGFAEPRRNRVADGLRLELRHDPFHAELRSTTRYSTLPSMRRRWMRTSGPRS